MLSVLSSTYLKNVPYLMILSILVRYSSLTIGIDIVMSFNSRNNPTGSYTHDTFPAQVRGLVLPSYFLPTSLAGQWAILLGKNGVPLQRLNTKEVTTVSQICGLFMYKMSHVTGSVGLLNYKGPSPLIEFLLEESFP